MTRGKGKILKPRGFEDTAVIKVERRFGYDTAIYNRKLGQNNRRRTIAGIMKTPGFKRGGKHRQSMFVRFAPMPLTTTPTATTTGPPTSNILVRQTYTPPINPASAPATGPKIMIQPKKL